MNWFKWLLKTIERIYGVITPHKHSIYIKCNTCFKQSINMPDKNEFQCPCCNSWDTTEYYPVRNHKEKK